MKLAQVGYGSQGQGAGKDQMGYTYIVNDNVRTGDTLNPSVIHDKSGKIFATTGKVLAMTKGLGTKQGEKIQKSLEQNRKTTEDIATVETGKELGIERSRTAKGTFESSTHDDKGNYIATKSEMATRGANILRRQEQTGREISQTKDTQKAVETFDSYSQRFMGEQQ